ncbi:peptidoglycan DD-metalloendopeptidase family protein [Adhaeribacter soli]|uniref:Peptidoglycan DD-metalloendopeptidase family protein n=1 Tax=Adhaeribacter soli TaxID=2607655 RepID=A0A5N1IXT9_9BACT|nr:peptidoglycan DD-metalloendopeptidase family protein [Adhaeribacter soli]
MFPIKPGQQNFLSGSMGEIRPSHFHGGIDIKTDGVTGLPVYASADGYVSRYKSSSFGYGNVIHLTHPNGLVTVYAHLEKFAAPLESYMLRKQYENQTFELDLKPEKDIFKFKKGDIIGYSGNTGGSGGPHLHFEIRDEKDNQYNVLKFKFPEIQDKTAPEITTVALRALSIDGRVNDQFGRFEFTPVKVGNNYKLKDTVYAHGVIGLEVHAFDRLDKSLNKNGVQMVELAINGKPIYQHYVDCIPLEKSRQVSWHINYAALKRSGKSFEKCYLDDGNDLPLYNAVQKGRFIIKPNGTYEVALTLKDSYNNASVLRFTIAGRKPAFQQIAFPKPKKPQIDYELSENILKITAADTAKHVRNVEMFVGRLKYNLLPSYSTAAGTTYLYDVRAGFPDSLVFCGVSLKPGFKQLVPSGQEMSYTDNNVALVFNKNSLYDTLYLKTAVDKDIFTVNDLYTPLFQPIKITLKPTTMPADPSKASVYSLGYGKSRIFEGGKWDGNTITATTKNLGKFRILSDTSAPTVKLLTKNKDVISFRVRDDLSGIASYRLEVNGKFVLLKYEHKKALLWSEKLDKKVPLSGEVVLRVKDNVGNEAVYKTKI